jgi:hypothetical protein
MTLPPAFGSFRGCFWRGGSVRTGRLVSEDPKGVYFDQKGEDARWN